jgi:hypothetical protein
MIERLRARDPKRVIEAIQDGREVLCAYSPAGPFPMNTSEGTEPFTAVSA